MQAALQQSPLPGALENPSQAFLQPVKAAKRVGRFEKVYVLIREIEGGFDQRPQLDQLVEEHAHFPGKLALQRTYRATGRRRGRGVDQIDDRLRLSQIELAVEVGPPRELAGIGQACTKLEAAHKQHLHDHRTAMPVQFEHIVAGEGMRGGKIQKQAGVDDHAIGRPELAEGRAASERSPAAQGFGEFKQARAGDANDAYATATGSGRDGGYRCCVLA